MAIPQFLLIFGLLITIIFYSVAKDKIYDDGKVLKKILFFIPEMIKDAYIYFVKDNYSAKFYYGICIILISVLWGYAEYAFLEIVSHRLNISILNAFLSLLMYETYVITTLSLILVIVKVNISVYVHCIKRRNPDLQGEHELRADGSIVPLDNNSKEMIVYNPPKRTIPKKLRSGSKSKEVKDNIIKNNEKKAIKLNLLPKQTNSLTPSSTKVVSNVPTKSSKGPSETKIVKPFLNKVEQAPNSESSLDRYLGNGSETMHTKLSKSDKKTSNLYPIPSRTNSIRSVPPIYYPSLGDVDFTVPKKDEYSSDEDLDSNDTAISIYDSDSE